MGTIWVFRFMLLRNYDSLIKRTSQHTDMEDSYLHNSQRVDETACILECMWACVMDHYMWRQLLCGMFLADQPLFLNKTLA